MIHQIQQEEKERVIEDIREWISEHIHEQEFDYMNGYYNLCVTSFDTETDFCNGFRNFRLDCHWYWFIFYHWMFIRKIID